MLSGCFKGRLLFDDESDDYIDVHLLDFDRASDAAWIEATIHWDGAHPTKGWLFERQDGSYTSEERLKSTRGEEFDLVLATVEPAGERLKATGNLTSGDEGHETAHSFSGELRPRPC